MVPGGVDPGGDTAPARPCAACTKSVAMRRKSTTLDDTSMVAGASGPAAAHSASRPLGRPGAPGLTRPLPPGSLARRVGLVIPAGAVISLAKAVAGLTEAVLAVRDILDVQRQLAGHRRRRGGL